ncbi:type IV pilus assembly protein PilN [Malonomonas rubra DSM 5091]|uniref:Type IV pilus assembly protein PilN n=1 Tax=Malonomonas rubra DSM 5091 TaxID=1122189 RepID=A0A1M6D7V1_MALRU|nr:PilN domain-containing protein [Malonomonas rubra]SHI69068.1 type IV pilus assembly protein PilN [Malonomonas rubra DSM 5091]
MIHINLLPVRAAQKKEKLKFQLFVLLLSLLVTGAICGTLYFKQAWAIDEINNEIASIEAKNKALRKKLGEVADFEKKKKEIEQKLSVLRELKEAKSGPVRLLDELSIALPEKVWLTQFSESEGNIKLSGFGDSEKTVALFMQKLEKSPYYKDVELSVTEQSAVGDVKMQKFSLNCKSEKPSQNK